MKPGIYPNANRAEYNALKAVNQSLIKRFMPNPWAWKQGLKPVEDSPSMIHGRLVEACLFDDKDALQEFAFFDKAKREELLAAAKERGHKGGFSKNLREYQSWKVSEIDQGKAIVDELAYADAQIAALCLRQEREVADFLDHPRLETNVMIVWVDPETELLCKGLIDCHLVPDPCLCDIKTSAAIMGKDLEGAARKFYCQALDLGYDIQAGAYLDGWNLARMQSTSEPYDNKHGWRFIVSGNERPYPPATFSLPREAIEQGRRKWHKGLKLWKQCRESGEYPGLTSAAPWMGLAFENFKQ